MDPDDLDITSERLAQKKQESPVPGVLVAHTSQGDLPRHYLEVEDSVVIGRAEKALILPDTGISRHHIRIAKSSGACWVEDLGSKNGTFLNGKRVTEGIRLSNQDVIRLGNTILVFHDDIRELRYEKGQNLWGMEGRFFTRKLVRELTAFALSSERALLLAGPDGTGKALAADTVARMLGRELVMLSSKGYDDDSSLTAALFGAGGQGASSGFESPGYVERSSGGVLFLDEVQGLSRRVQQLLVPLLETGAPAGNDGSRKRPLDIRFVLASRGSGPSCGLTLDLLARLKVVRLSALHERLADIPSLFTGILFAALERAGQDASSIAPLLTAPRHSFLMRHGFKKDNILGLVALADVIVASVFSGVEPAEAIENAFSALKQSKSKEPDDGRLDDVTRKVGSLIYEEE